MIGWILVLLVAGLVAYVRLAPSDAGRWHQKAYPAGMGETEKPGGLIWREPVAGSGRDALRSLDRIIMDTPRTVRLAGSVTDGQITYLTRSLVLGFPDYTTIGVYKGLIDDPEQHYLEVFGRLRFGRSDFGVNARRIRGWLAEFQAGG